MKLYKFDYEKVLNRTNAEHKLVRKGIFKTYPTGEDHCNLSIEDMYKKYRKEEFKDIDFLVISNKLRLKFPC